MATAPPELPLRPRLNAQHRRELKKSNKMLEKYGEKADLGKLKNLLRHKGADPNRLIANTTRVDVAKVSLDHGADVDHALQTARTEEIAELALSRGAVPDDSIDHITHPGVMDAVLRHGGNANKVWVQALSPEMKAVAAKHGATLFLAHGPVSGYEGEFHQVGAARGARMGLSQGDPRVRTIAFSAQEKRDNTLLFDELGRARLADGRSVAGQSFSFTIDPSDGTTILFPRLAAWFVETGADGVERRTPMDPGMPQDKISQHLDAHPGMRLEMLHHSSVVAAHAREQGPSDGREIPAAALRSALSGDIEFTDDARLMAVTNVSGHYRQGGDHVLQGLEQWARDGGLFTGEVADARGVLPRDSLGALLHEAIETKRLQLPRILLQIAELEGNLASPGSPRRQDERALLLEEVATLRAAEAFARRQGIGPARKLNPDIHLVVMSDGQPRMHHADAFLKNAGDHMVVRPPAPGLPYGEFYNVADAKEKVLAELREKRRATSPTHASDGAVAAASPRELVAVCLSLVGDGAAGLPELRARLLDLCDGPDPAPLR